MQEWVTELAVHCYSCLVLNSIRSSDGEAWWEISLDIHLVKVIGQNVPILLGCVCCDVQEAAEQKVRVLESGPRWGTSRLQLCKLAKPAQLWASQEQLGRAEKIWSGAYEGPNIFPFLLAKMPVVGSQTFNKGKWPRRAGAIRLKEVGTLGLSE